MADLEIEDKVWESEVIFIDSLKQEGTVYRHVPNLKLDPTDRDPEPLGTYCPEGEFYVRLVRRQCERLSVLEKEPELYLSVHFLNICMTGDSKTHYQWQAYRTPQHDDDMVFQPIKGIDGNRTGYYRPVKELEYRKWKSMIESPPVGTGKDTIRGGYQVPARRRNGRAEMVGLHKRFTSMADAELWASIFRSATSLWSISNAGAAFRGIDPKGITVYILPSSRVRGIGEGANITWTDVKDGFEELPSRLSTKYTVLENSQAIEDKGLVLYSNNPFFYYSSYVSKDTAEAFGLYSSRPLKLYTDEAGDKLAEKMEPRQSEVKIQKRLARDGIVMERTNGSISLSASRMLKATSKRSETSSQKTVMGISAPELARDYLGWGSQNKDTSKSGQDKHTAEWLHISAFSFGGLTDGSKAWETSQIQPNMMFGTWEMNSWMLRYEAAFQRLFKLERDFRKQAEVVGQLRFKSFEPPEQNEKSWFDNCDWIHFEIQWNLEMKEKSHLLDKDLLAMGLRINPFNRSCFTKGEAMVDIALLKTIFNRKAEGVLRAMKNERLGAESVLTISMGKQDDGRAFEVLLADLETQLVLSGNINRLDSPDDLQSQFTQPRDSLFTAVNNEAVEMKTLEAPGKGDMIVVGGIPLTNTRLIVLDHQGKYANLPVTVRGIDSFANEAGLLLVPAAREGQITVAQASKTKPILILSSSPRLGMEVIAPSIATVSQVAELATKTFREAGALPAADYVLQGDVQGLFGITGLSGELLSIQGSGPQDPIQEKVKPYLSSSADGYIATLFPSLNSDIIQKLPIDNVEFTYSNKLDDFHNPEGLSLNADITFTGPLSPVKELLQFIYSGNEDNTPPTKLRVQARLSPERNWREPLELNNFALRGSVDQSLRLGDIIRFRKVGVEVSVISISSFDNDKNKTTWKLGYGLCGELEISKIQKTGLPLTVKYWMRKIGDTYSLSMALSSHEWTSVFGIENLDVTGVEFQASIDINNLEESLVLGVSAMMKLGDGDIFLAGQYSKSETYLEAEVGNMTWGEIVKAYTQITGKSVDAATNVDELEFENMHIMISTAGIEIRGKICFNGATSAAGYITFDNEGLSIGGAIGSFHVPDTNIVIEEAGLDIFIGSRGSDKKSGRASRLALKGLVHFQGIRVAAGLETSTDGSPNSRRWIVYGAYEGNLRLSALEAAKTLKEHPDLDIELKYVTIIASNKKGIWTDPLSKRKYSLSDGLSLFALIDPLPAINNLARNKTVGGLTLIASISAQRLSVEIELPDSIGIDMGDIAKVDRFSVGLDISSKPNLTLSCDLRINMAQQPPLTFHSNLKALLHEANGEIYLDPEVPWRNPFGVSDKIIVQKLGGSVAFRYASVLVEGPSELAFGGMVKCGNFTGEAFIVVTKLPTRQVLKVNISNVNVSELIRMAGEIGDLDALRNISAGDFLVFNKAEMYFSTGIEEALGEEFPAGISAKGDVTVFGKRANFEASLGSGGFELRGEVDAFKIGPLEVRSASGNPRAKLQIATTSEKQLLEIDGLVIIGGDEGLQIGALIRASLNPVVLDVWVFVSFTDQIKFDLRAVATNVANLKDLSQANVNFTLTLNTEILELFYNGILDFLAELQNIATASTEALEFVLQKRRNEISDEVKIKKKQISALKTRIVEEKEIRDKERAKAELKKLEAEAELEKLQRAADTTKQAKKEAEDELKDLLKQIDLEREAIKAEKRLEWASLLESAEKEQERLSKERAELQGKKKSTFGNVALELEKYNEWFNIAKAKLAGLLADSNERKKNLPNLGILARVKELIYINTIDAAATFLTNRLEEGAGVLQDYRDTLNRPEFRDIEIQIQEKDAALQKATEMVDRLAKQGLEGFIEAALEDKDKFLKARKAELDAMQDGNSRWMQAIREAQAKLDAGRPDLDRVIDEEQEKINQARDSMQLRQLQQELQSAEDEERRKREQHEAISTGLRMIQNEIDRGSESVRQLVQSVKPVNFKIKGVTITADGKEIAQGRAMSFKITVEHEGKIIILEETWAPFQKPAELYRDIMKGLLKN
ncbi:hypothetical protein FPRO05_12622 [Fusarium proliferatum]|uniref:Uncharacterized protein n=1 Tax=Gibberella intermedia TaxID=948311 RepID=A0A365N4N0_GIBIN|nr:hypothetical protein FPRO05_12622 [Fusarium proliferatum]